jgi:predicted phosphodiesterase
MALYGVLADIHGNREALQASLAALERRGIRKLLCLGDIVGYNADPDECAEMLKSRGALAIAGTHDLIGTGRLGFERCSNQAMYALKRTRRSLARGTGEWLASLPPQSAIGDDVVLVHDVKHPARVAQNAEWLRADFPKARLCLFGHGHEQKVYEVEGSEVRELAGDRILLNRKLLYFVSPGSVDASRKSSHKAAEFAILDTLDWSIEFLRLPYDSASSEAKAAVFGYRIGRWTDRFYSVRRKLLRRRPSTAAGQ